MFEGLKDHIDQLSVQMSVAELCQELEKKEVLYNGFVASVESALKERNGTTRTAHDLAETIVNRLIGLE